MSDAETKSRRTRRIAGAFQFTPKNKAEASKILARYPEGREASAVLPLLTLAQKQNGWVSADVVAYLSEFLGMSEVKVWEVVSFYTLFYKKPMGKHVIQVCGTTPCMLKGSEGVMKSCRKWLGISEGETTRDQMFSLLEVECLGACVNAPVVQINDDFYEDLDEKSILKVLESLAEENPIKPGSLKGRSGSAPYGFHKEKEV